MGEVLRAGDERERVDDGCRERGDQGDSKSYAENFVDHSGTGYETVRRDFGSPRSTLRGAAFARRRCNRPQAPVCRIPARYARP